MSSGSSDLNQYDSFVIIPDNEGTPEAPHTNGWEVPLMPTDWSWEGKNLTVRSPELSGANHGVKTSNLKLNGHLNTFKVVVEGDSKSHGLFSEHTNGIVNLSAEHISITAPGHGIFIAVPDVLSEHHDIQMRDFETLDISSGSTEGSGIVVNRSGKILLWSEKANSEIHISSSTQMYDHVGAITNKTRSDTTPGGVSKIDLKANTIILNEDAGDQTGYNGIYSGENGLKITDGSYIDSQISLTGKDIQVYGAYFGIIQNGKGTVSLNAENGTNLVKLTADKLTAWNPDDRDDVVGDEVVEDPFMSAAIRVNGAQNKLGKVELQAQTNIVNGYDGDGIAIYSEGLSNVVLTATNVNEVQGVVISGVRPTEEQQPSNVLSNISFNGNTNLVSSYLVEHKYEDSDSNYQYALGVLSMSEGLIKYEEGSTVSLKTHFNEVDNDEQSIRERLVWAYGGEVNLNKTQLSAVTQHGMSFDNSVGIALVASDGGKVNAQNLMTGSRIVGDIVGGIGGYVDLSLDRGNGTYVRRDTAATDADIRGNALAANGGRVDMSLGSGSVWLGRADDYRDADQAGETWSGVHTEFFTPQFSDTITSSGTVNIALAKGAIWAITGQSWVTTLAGEGGIIDLSGGTDTNSHALRVWNVQGSHTFVLDLNHLDHTTSDMLYLKTQPEVSALALGDDRASSMYVQNIVLENIQGLEEMAPGTQIRFATVDGNIAFKPYGVEGTANVVQISDQGLVNSGFVIGSEAYDPNNNDNYNGSKPEGDATKPGDAWTDSAFGNGTNWYLTRDPSKDTLSDAGKTVLSLSKANYSTAVYMDTLNKRQGEARFGTGQDEGLWVRLRYDDIEKVDAFTSSNTMTEIGYDLKVESDNGVHRRGIAVDYMNGSLDYSGVRGSGDIERLGAWLYNTWIGNDGHYTDIVLKWGHLDNDFDVLAPSTLQTISGGYTNDVFSASVEYGYRWMDENSNYIEPQVQFQYSYVTDADYTTSQASKVKLDSINSYIARVGFRAGHHWENDKDIYLKFDLLHEFDGEQRVRASDKGGKFDFTIDNDGTWADFGVGFSMKMDNDSYFFIDAEKIIGNDYGSTYQVSGGIRINF